MSNDESIVKRLVAEFRKVRRSEFKGGTLTLKQYYEFVSAKGGEPDVMPTLEQFIEYPDDCYSDGFPKPERYNITIED